MDGDSGAQGRSEVQRRQPKVEEGRGFARAHYGPRDLVEDEVSRCRCNDGGGGDDNGGLVLVVELEDSRSDLDLRGCRSVSVLDGEESLAVRVAW